MDANDQEDHLDDSMDESESGIMMAKRMRLARRLTTIEAHIIHDALAAGGIKSRIRRKFGSAALALQPISGVELWVFPNDYAAAKEILASLQAAEGDPVACDACAETSPGHFATCWNCGAALGGEAEPEQAPTVEVASED